MLERLAPFSLEAECDFHFLEEDGEIYIPLAAWLAAVAQEHFAFFSTQETAGVGQPHVDGEALEGVREESGLVDLIQRMNHVESVPDFQQDRMRTLVAQRSASPVTQALGAAHSCTQGQECSPTTFEATIYICTGHLFKAVEDFSLTWMQRLCKQQFKLASHTRACGRWRQWWLLQNTKAKKVQDVRRRILLGLLPQQEDAMEEEAKVEDDAGFPEPSRDLGVALDKLTSIVELLTGNKKKATLSSSEAGCSPGQCQPGGLRFWQKMWEGIVQCLPGSPRGNLPGQQPRGLSARAWIESRSRISA